MKLNKTIFIFVLFLFVALPMCFAAPAPKAYPAYTTGYLVEEPYLEFVQIGERINLNVHLFNNSNGYPITDAVCSLHLYNGSGRHIYETNTTISSAHNWDYEFPIMGGNFSYPGLYSYIIGCRNDSQRLGGFSQNYFFVIKGSKIYNPIDRNDKTSGISITLFILFISGLLLWGAFRKERYFALDYTEMIVRKSLLTIGAFLTIFNIGIMAQIVDKSDLGLTQEFFTYMYIFQDVAYVCLIILMVKSAFDINKVWKDNLNQKRGI